jgi:PAS domain S-box-containing protein
MQPTSELHPSTFLHAVLDSVGVAMIVIDSDGKFVFCNQAAQRMFGTGNLNRLSALDVISNYVFRDSRGRPIPPEQTPVMRALTGEQVPPERMEVTLPDGRTKWTHLAGHQFEVFGMTGVFVIITDETEQVELRLALERAQRAEEFGLLAGGMVHDFNNMLSVVSENIALLQTRTNLPENAQAQLLQMTAAVERAAAMAKRLARDSRVQEPQTRVLQINDLVNVALDLVRPLFKDRVIVKTELGPVPAVEVDPARIEQVLVNLILNAIDAMPEGGELTVGTALVDRPPAAEIESDEGERNGAKSFVCVTVADTGIGIPENLQGNIFDPFFTTKPVDKGSGLGLATARAVVRQHSGFIKVHSTPGAGTKFCIYLPAKEDSSAKNRQETAA